MNSLLSLGSERQPTWARKRDPRLRVVAALWLALVAVSLSQPLALASLLLLVLLLAGLLRLPWSLLFQRLLAFEGFMLVLTLMLPFSVAGDPLFQLAGFSASEQGVERALVILLRANTVVIGMLTLLGTLEPEQLGHALGRLKLPDKLVHLFLLSVRYLFVLLDEYRRLRTAMRARAFTPRSDRHTWRSYGWLVGMLLVRSMERSQRVLAAMKCRGFHGRLYLLDNNRWQLTDSGLLLLFILLAAGPWLWESGMLTALPGGAIP
ncbi:cobalt ECF transporter T component CbiQ [Motiliproteus sediminis]|uniref:cobalt ECF transporter T component CbiQ n=1 Tax=Motiliproteus sediminis TaxID=1468178 RepID=UPI001AF0113B|nr:cobalt ECF transporter T component CbiQ [Motiliproteus sediminis]